MPPIMTRFPMTKVYHGSKGRCLRNVIVYLSQCDNKLCMSNHCNIGDNTMRGRIFIVFCNWLLFFPSHDYSWWIWYLDHQWAHWRYVIVWRRGWRGSAVYQHAPNSPQMINYARCLYSWMAPILHEQNLICMLSAWCHKNGVWTWWHVWCRKDLMIYGHDDPYHLDIDT